MKAIMFDFDGTLTIKSPNIWKAIWGNLGYETGKGSYFSMLFIMFLTKDITHQKWCDLTCEKFMEKGLHKDLVKSITKQIRLNDGATETFKTLKEMGYSLHIISGNFKSVIKEVLGENAKYFDSINANEFEYDKNGYVVGIKGTNYDFEGKAHFITEFKEKNNMPAKDICFVGNGDNDEWAHLSGCRTLCVNPENTDITNKTKWHHAIENVTNLTQILPEFEDNQME